MNEPTMNEPTMNEPSRNEHERAVALERQWRRELRSLEARIDPGATQRLSRCRREALAAVAPRRRLGPRWLAPAGGMAFACALSLWALAPHLPIASSQWHLAAPAPGQAPPAAEELYEHLDFYSWLANNPTEIDPG